jgi:Leucine-rich repeat (LRR) protein
LATISEVDFLQKVIYDRKKFTQAIDKLGDFFDLHLKWYTKEIKEKGANLINEVKFCKNDKNKNFYKIYSTNNDLSLLSYLSLNSNKTLNFDTSSFEDLNRLEHLSLANNLICSIEENRFPSELLTLNLSNNCIEKIPPGTFIKCINLISLDLSFNRIAELGCFLIWQKLQKLYLQHNSIKSINFNVFEKFYRLEQIDLSKNQLIKIERNTFDCLRSLRYLSLDHNIIGFVDDKAFEGLGFLVELNLSCNLITRLDVFQFQSLNNLAELKLNGNPIENEVKLNFQKKIFPNKRLVIHI